MSEFWKSNPRKFCEFCKVWIADNKPSIQIHENGKMHKDNVDKNLRDVRKKSALAKKTEDNVAKQLKAIEKAAMAAYEKDLESNPQLAEDSSVKRQQQTVPSATAEVKAISATSAPKQSPPSAQEAPVLTAGETTANKETEGIVQEIERKPAPKDDNTGYGGWTSVSVVAKTAAVEDSDSRNWRSNRTAEADTPQTANGGGWTNSVAPVVDDEPPVKFTEKETPLLAPSASSTVSGDEIGFKKRKAASQKSAVIRKKPAIE
eukprot:Opistho-2@26178